MVLGKAVNKLAECPFEMASLVELPMLLLWMVWALSHSWFHGVLLRALGVVDCEI